MFFVCSVDNRAEYNYNYNVAKIMTKRIEFRFLAKYVSVAQLDRATAS